MALSHLEMEARIEFYKKVLPERVFSSHVKRQPSLWPVDAYEEKIIGLLKRGFTNPVNLIILNPSILGYSFEVIDAKISGLKDRGFKDPVMLITSMPAILGYSFKNIDRKIRFARRVNYPYFIELIEYCPLLIGVSIKRYVYTARILKDDETLPSFARINKIHRMMPR